jgi:hypothetical protein
MPKYHRLPAVKLPRRHTASIEVMEEALRNNIATTLGLAFCLLATPLAVPAPAYAVTININVGSNLNHGRPISCREGERRIRDHGFRDVRRIDCRGRTFVYRAWRGSQRFEISLDSRNGRVSDVRRIRR